MTASERIAARGAVDAVCFDLDGTLIRSEEIRDAVRRDYVVAAGGTWSRSAQREMSGMHLLEWAHYMHDRLGVRRPPAVIAREIESRIEVIYREGIPLVDGARETLARCAALWPLALATGSTHRLIDLVLDRGGLREYFAVTVSVDDVAAAKPAPDVYLRAAALLSVPPHRCVAVEDSLSGIRSAIGAGMHVIAIGSRVPGIKRMEPAVTRSAIEHLRDLSPERIRAAGSPPLA
jgi:HAD superfamily hydrolase (TIGR01509 family)